MTPSRIRGGRRHGQPPRRLPKPFAFLAGSGSGLRGDVQVLAAQRVASFAEDLLVSGGGVRSAEVLKVRDQTEMQRIAASSVRTRRPSLAFRGLMAPMVKHEQGIRFAHRAPVGLSVCSLGPVPTPSAVAVPSDSAEPRPASVRSGRTVHKVIELDADVPRLSLDHRITFALPSVVVLTAPSAAEGRVSALFDGADASSIVLSHSDTLSRKRAVA